MEKDVKNYCTLSGLKENSSEIKEKLNWVERKTFVIDALPPADASILSQLNMSGDLYLINDTATTEIYTLSLHDALPICKEKLFQKTKLLGFKEN